MVSVATPIYSERRIDNIFVVILWVGPAAAVSNALHVLVSGLWQPLLDIHSFGLSLHRAAPDADVRLVRS